jgi:predicted GNAT family N-acyltransferase
VSEAPRLRVRRVEPAVVHPLRQRVLRPHQALDDQALPGDDAPGAAHFAAYDEEDRVVGIASITPEAYPRGGGSGDFRIRGMATDPDAGRGRGLGGALLHACLEHARAASAARVWCNARSPVRGFYEREGFVVDGEEFELPEIGPHFLMVLSADVCGTAARG